MEPEAISDTSGQELRTPAPRKSNAALAGILFLLIAGAAFTWAYNTLGDGLMALTWPRAKCSILTSYAIEADKTLGLSGYIPMVNYKFDAEGQMYTNVVVHMPRKYFKTEAEAKAVAAKYPVDSEHMCAYKPGDPSTAVLEPGMGDPIATACLGIAGVSILAAIVSFVMAAIKRR